MIAIGTGIGVGVSYLMRRLATPIDSYQQHTMPVPSGTDGDAMPSFERTTAGSNGSGSTDTANIDLRSGAPTTS
jgi:hypothetical protein